jgi:ABC-2 type transport system permease protein
VIRATLILAGHSLTRIRSIVVGLGLLLAVFQFLLTQIAAYLLRHSYFGQLSLLMPDFIRTVAGPTALTFMSFTGVVAFGYFHPMVMAALIGLTIAITTEPAAEVEMRFVDLTLARPLTRVDILARTGIVFVTAAISVVASMTVGTWAGLACCAPADAPPVPATLVASLAASLLAIMTCWAGLTLAIAAAARRRAVAGAIAGAAALAAYLADYVGRAWEPARLAGALTPFHYFEPMALILGGSPRVLDIGMLLGIGATAATIAVVVFSRRDI